MKPIRIELKSSSQKQMKQDIHSSGLKNLDNLIGGFAKGELVLVGRPYTDITKCLINLAITFSKKGSVFYFTSHQSQSSVIDHIISSLFKMPVEEIVRGHPTFDDTATIATFLFPKILNKIHIHDSCSNSMEVLKHLHQQLIEKHKLKFIIVDNLQKLCQPQDEIKFVRKIKSIAKDFGIIAIVVTEISDVENRGELYHF